MYTAVDLPSSEVHLLFKNRSVNLPYAKAVRLEAQGRKEGARRGHDEVDQRNPQHLESDCASSKDRAGVISDSGAQQPTIWGSTCQRRKLKHQQHPAQKAKREMVFQNTAET